MSILVITSFWYNQPMRMRLIFIFIALIIFTGKGTPASADILSESHNFYINKDFDKYGREISSFTLRYISEKAYLYVDDTYWNELSTSGRENFQKSLESLGNEFDSAIYPRETAFYGNEANPGIDGDPRIVLGIQSLKEGYGGYFDTVHSYSKQEATQSNAREMIFINALATHLDVDLARMFLAHEFLHLISFNQKERLNSSVEDIWLNEARAEYGVSVSGYNTDPVQSNLAQRKDTFIENPTDSLTEWQNKHPDYASVLIFTHYLVEQYGQDILKETLRSKTSGIASINEYLAAKGYGEKFSDIFVEWMAANYLNDVSLSPRLGYRDPFLRDFKIRALARSMSIGGLADIDQSVSVKPWQPAWVEFNLPDLAQRPEKSIRLDVYGQPGQSFIGGYIVFYENAQPEFGRIPVIGNEGSAYILNSEEKRISKVILMATHSSKTSDFNASEPSYNVTLRTAIVDSSAAKAQQVKDGDLIKKSGQNELYVIERGYKRYLSPEIIRLYGHLDPAKAISVTPEAFDSYKTSNYIKNVNDKKVYASWPDNTKHWLNMTGEYFASSGRDWGAVFIINDLELNYYRTGVDITR